MIMNIIKWISDIWDWYLTIGIICALLSHIKHRIRCNKSSQYAKLHIVWKYHLPSLILWIVAFPIKFVLLIVDSVTQ